jgi:hypothetical protein
VTLHYTVHLHRAALYPSALTVPVPVSTSPSPPAPALCAISASHCIWVCQPTSVTKGTSEEMATKIKEVQEELKSTLARVSECHKQYYDKATRKLPQWEIGSKVWVKHDEAISMSRPSKKLEYKWLGPYEITEHISDMAYKLKLPTSMKIHPVINTDRLQEAKPDEIPGREHPRPEPVVTTPEAQEWEVEYIDDSHYHYNKLQYHVKWHR